MGFDVVCVGETMVMVTPTVGPLSIDATCVLRAGGAESTVAMYLASLGHRAAWASRLGADRLGDLVLAEVAGAGVNTALVKRSETEPTGVFFKDPRPGHTAVYYYRRGSAAAAMDPAYAARLATVDTRVLHLTGVTVALSQCCREMVDSLVDGPRRSLISFDVNHRPALWMGERRADVELLRLARAADVVFVGRDEAARLWGTPSADEVRDLIRGPILVVKDGPVEAVAFHGAGRTVVPAPKVDVVEPVGAGDAFAAGWLSGMLRGLDQETRLRLGHLVAGVALRSVGDFAPLPAEIRDPGWIR